MHPWFSVDNPSEIHLLTLKSISKDVIATTKNATGFLSRVRAAVHNLLTLTRMHLGCGCLDRMTFIIKQGSAYGLTLADGCHEAAFRAGLRELGEAE